MVKKFSLKIGQSRVTAKLKKCILLGTYAKE
jgi:hypothetical protein